jgi:O-methyltransferase domain
VARQSKDDRAFTRAVLGAPVVPPGSVTRGVLRLRRGLGRVQREAVPGSLRILDGLFGLFDNRVLGLLCELEIPEHLESPRTVDELAVATGAPIDAMDRLLRFSAARGFVGVDRKGRYRANAVTAMLRRDQPGSWRGWVEFASSDWFWAAWRRADAPFTRDPESGMLAAIGTDFFDFLEHGPPAAGAAFHAAMEAGATMQAVALSHGLDWDTVRRVCDVGGGTGAALRTLTRLRPELEPLLFDRPEVVAGAPADLPSVGGDFFVSVPEGCDRYLLLAVVHDWDDAEATRLLRCVRDALPEHGSAVVVENVLPDRPRDEFAVASDLLMLVLGPGRERTRAEFDALFAAAGFTLARHVVLPTGFSAFVLVAAH